MSKIIKKPIPLPKKPVKATKAKSCSCHCGKFMTYPEYQKNMPISHIDAAISYFPESPELTKAANNLKKIIKKLSFE
jgi:hypothetical protein